MKRWMVVPLARTGLLVADHLDEVSRSVVPASPYGKAAEYLKQATKDMQRGQKSNAAQQLAQSLEFEDAGAGKRRGVGNFAHGDQLPRLVSMVHRSAKLQS